MIVRKEDLNDLKNIIGEGTEQGVIYLNEVKSQLNNMQELINSLNISYENQGKDIVNATSDMMVEFNTSSEQANKNIAVLLDRTENVLRMLAETRQDVMTLYQKILLEADDLARVNLRVRMLESKLDEIIREKEDEAIQIVETERFENNFKWCVSRKAHDNVTNYVKGGYIGYDPDWDAIDESLWSLLPLKGVFLDIGANIGAFTLPLCSFGWSGYAIEASHKNCELLEKSIKINNFDVILLEKAVWNKTGKVNFLQKGPQGFVEDQVHTNEEYEVVDAIALDDYKKIDGLAEIEKIEFIKMDIEGSEIFALEGMKSFLDDMGYPPIYLEVNIWNLFCMDQSPKSLFEILNKLGYSPYKLYKGSLIKYDINQFPSTPCEDYLFLNVVPQYLKTKIFEARAFDIVNNVDFVMREMSNFRNWAFDYGTNPNEVLAHIAWYSIVNEYPECNENDEIKKIMDDIEEQLKPLNNSIFEKMIKNRIH